MKKISYSKLNDFISTNKFNFVGFVMTPWHKVGALAAIKFIESKNVSVKPLLVIQEHEVNGILLEEDPLIETVVLENSENEKINIFKYMIFLLNNHLPIKDVNNSLFIAMPWFGNYKLAYRILARRDKTVKFVIFEEGIRSYDYKFYTILNYFSWSYSVLHVINTIINLKWTWYNLKIKRLYFLTPFIINNKFPLCINPVSVKFYKKALNIHEMNLNAKNVVIIIQTHNGDEIQLIKRVIQHLNNANYTIYIKPHPRYPISNNNTFGNVNILPHGMAIEEVERSLKAKYFIGFTSTALLTMKYLYGAETISLNNLLKGTLTYTKNVEMYAAFYKRFSPYIKFISNIDEIK